MVNVIRVNHEVAATIPDAKINSMSQPLMFCLIFVIRIKKPPFAFPQRAVFLHTTKANPPAAIAASPFSRGETIKDQKPLLFILSSP